MCGIAGFVLLDGIGPNGVATEDERRGWLKAMCCAISHRGPDGHGIWMEGPVALGHRRLSVIDLANGAQPMVDAANRAVVTFNGEIYTFLELKDDLAGRGYRFLNCSDTEVLINAYLDQGKACLDRFEGMFAFALWDREQKILFAARDRFGKKPFFYTLQNGVFAFASELTALVRLPLLSLTVVPEDIAYFLAYEYVPTPRSIYSEVYKLPPGHYLILQDGRIRIESYWDMPPPDESGRCITAADEIDLAAELRCHMETAVRRRLVSDVPLGVFLSGGIDSSTVCAYMARMLPQVKSFSVAFTEASYNESSYVRAVTSMYATEHHEYVLSAEACGSLLPELMIRFDEPMADPSIVPTFLLSQMTRQDVTVALSGDGSDELFAGYEHYAAFVWAERYLALPRMLRKKVLEPLARRLPNSAGYVNPRMVAEKFIAGTDSPRWLRCQCWLAAFSGEAQDALWQPAEASGLNHSFFAQDLLFASTWKLYNHFSAKTPLAKLFYLFARQFMLDYILVKVDRCAMLNSLEVRTPFLDRDLSEFVCRLPVSLKLHGNTRKYLLKLAVEHLVPQKIRKRPKRGFLIPTAQWLKESLRPLLEELCAEPRIKAQGLFEHSVLRRMMDEHFTGVVDHRKELWTMLVLQLWLKEHNPSIAKS
ncbi:asparagine synthase (glutamine-hydrolysing) [Desulfovibrionales bacterium]